MKAIRRSELSERASTALQAAETSLSCSYCPHSQLKVAACLMLSDGRCVTGVNYESDSYGLTLCAERTAIASAQAQGCIEQTEALVLVAEIPAGLPLTEALTPCGACRQWLGELAQRLGRDLPVTSFLKGAEEGFQTSALALLPDAFSM